MCADFGNVGEEGESVAEENSHRNREGSGFYVAGLVLPD
jgi:hypothetical protein